MADKNFKSKAAYLKWIKYGHASGEFKETPGNQSVSIRNKNKKVEHTKYLNGGQLQPPPDEPTFQDSLDVYNNSMKVQKYYNALPSEKTVNYLNAYKAQKKYSDSFLKDVTNKNKNVTKKISNDPDKYFFKDEIYGAIDENAPDIEYNTKIAPQGTLTYAPKGSNELYKIQKELRTKYKGLDTYDDESLRKNLTPAELKKFTKLVTSQANSSTQMPGQEVSVPYYSPLAIKPAKLLTDEEIIERVKKYGPSGIDPKKIESLGINVEALNKNTRPNTTKKVTSTTKPAEQVIVPTTVQKDSIVTAVEQAITPTGKTNQVPGGVISYTSQPRFIKDKYGKLVPNTNTQTKENFVGYKQEKAYGGYINEIDAPEIGGQFVRKMAKGGDLITKLSPKEETDFQNFYKTLPDNLKQDDNTYDLRGYWDSENRPSAFDYSQPVESDGYYHAYSRNQYTDKILKAPTHKTFRMAIEEDKKGGLAPLIGVDGNVYTKGEFIPPVEDETGAPLNTNMLIDSRAYGGYINEMAKGGNIKYGTPEYNKAYREGTIARQVGDEFIMNLPDAEAMAEKYAVTAKSPMSEKYPYWNNLSEEQKKYINDSGSIGRGVRAQATSGYGINNNPTFAKSASDFAMGSLTAGPVGFGKVLQTPQSLAVEGVEALRGNPYNFSDAVNIDPYSDTQRSPSDTFLKDAPGWAGFVGDVILDPTNLLGASFIKNPFKTISSQAFRPGKLTLAGKNIADLTANQVKNINKVKRFEDAIDIYQAGEKQLTKSLPENSSIVDKITPKKVNQFIDQLHGELKQGSKNRAAIKEGNDWLKTWIDHPATQAKIDKDLVKKTRNTIRIKGEPPALIDNVELAREQSKNFIPESREYPLTKQISDLIIPGRKNIHGDNWGVSYRHSEDPLRRILRDNVPVNKYTDSWISRTSKMNDKTRTSTTIHEGTHDWATDYALQRSGQKDFINNQLDPADVELSTKWNDLRNQGIDPSNQMTKAEQTTAYYADPTEVHARVMELRKHFKLKPDIEVDPDMAWSMIRNMDETTVGKGFKKIIGNNPERLANLMNRLWMAPAAVVGSAATVKASQEKAFGGYINAPELNGYFKLKE
jgi:hypothetical protein